MLDKEMAEEKAEAAELELEEVKEKLAVMQVEMSVLKGDEGMLDFLFGRFSIDVSTSDRSATGEAPEKNTLAYIQLEKQNERLKEALIK